MPRLAGLIIAALFATLAPALAQQPAEVGQMRLRIQELENQNRQLLGQVETLSHQVRMLQNQLAGGTAGAPSGSTAQMQPPQPAQTAGAAAGQIQPPPMPQGTMQQGAIQPGTIQPGTMQPGGAGPSGTGNNNLAAGGFNQRQTPQQPVPGTAGPGAPPQTLGQVPGRPLDLNALTQAGQAITEQGQPFSGRIASAPSDSPKDAYDLSYGYILRGDYQSAQASFTDFLQRFPGDPLVGNARYWLGEAYFAQRQFREAAESFLTAYTEHKDGPKAPDSLLKLGMSLNQLQQKDAACSTFQQLGKEYPHASRTVLETMRAEASRAGC
ncbi:MAG: tol-pal system protein YbgF [Flavobacteriaceae bacterium]